MPSNMSLQKLKWGTQFEAHEGTHGQFLEGLKPETRDKTRRDNQVNLLGLHRGST